MAGSRLKEEEVFTANYAKLCDTITDVHDLLPQFVQKCIISENEMEEIGRAATRVDKVKMLLSHISGPLRAGDSNGYYVMLDIMEEHGTQATKQLAGDMKRLHADNTPEEDSQPSEHTLNSLFSAFITTVIEILEKSPDKLEACKQYSLHLTISDNSHVLIFGNEMLAKINECSSFRDLITSLRQHINWKEFSILNNIIGKSGSGEAKAELKKFRHVMSSHMGMKAISEKFPPNNLPPNYIRLSIIIDKAYEDFTLHDFYNIRDFVFEHLDIKPYVAWPYIKYLFSSIDLEWFVPVQAAAHIIKMVYQNEKELAKNLVAYVQVGDKVVLDLLGKSPNTAQEQSKFEKQVKQSLVSPTDEKISSSLICSVCYKLFNNPKYLPCYHSYCEECLEKMVVQSKITCPECRREHTVLEGEVKELSNNFLICRMVDELMLKRKVEGTVELKCDVCDSFDPVVAFCTDCMLFFCYYCKEAHSYGKNYHGHDIVELAELKSNFASISWRKKILKCQEHDLNLDHYCNACSMLVCKCCIKKDHSEHNYKTVDKTIGEYRPEFKKASNSMKDMLCDLSDVYESIEMSRNNIREQGKKVSIKIDQHYDELIQKLIEQKEQLKQHVQDSMSKKENLMTTQLHEVEFIQEKLLGMQDMKDAMDKGSDQEMLSARKPFTDCMQQLTDKYDKIKTTTVKATNIEFIPTEIPLPQFGEISFTVSSLLFEVKNLPQALYSGQRVEFDIVTTDDAGIFSPPKTHQVKVQLVSNTGEVTCGDVRPNNDSNYTASLVAQQVGEATLSVDVDGHQTKGSPYNLVVSRNYLALVKCDKTLNNDELKMGHSWGLAFSRNGIWAVAYHSKQCICIFDHEDKLITRFGKLGSSNGEFRSPHGITFDDDNHLYVADFSNHRVQKFDINGKYLSEFGKTDEVQLRTPVGIAAHKDRVYVADKGQDFVVAFKNDGKFCCTIGEDQICRPYDVAVNTQNLLLVACIADDKHCVCTFTIDGHYVGSFGTPETSGIQLSYPHSLTTDSNGFTLVTDTGNHRICIFDKEGKCVHTFGSKGSEKTNGFNNPNGIALSPSGSIYVGDHLNRRIQMFLNY